jgi:hypothetical protein
MSWSSSLKELTYLWRRRVPEKEEGAKPAKISHLQSFNF